MKSELKKVNQCKREIEIEIPADEVSKEFNRILNQFAGRAKLKGFRPGKAPIDLIKQMYYADIKDSLINSLAPKALTSFHNLL